MALIRQSAEPRHGLAVWLSHSVAGFTTQLVGDGLIFLILVGLSFYMWWRAQQQKVDSSNVNADWDDSTNSVIPADVREAAVTPKDPAVTPKDSAAV